MPWVTDAALFSVVNAALWGWSDALEDPDGLVMVWKGRGEEQWPTTPADFHDWREQSAVFTDLAAFHYQSVSLTTGDRRPCTTSRVWIPAVVTYRELSHQYPSVLDTR